MHQPQNSVLQSRASLSPQLSRCDRAAQQSDMQNPYPACFCLRRASPRRIRACSRRRQPTSAGQWREGDAPCPGPVRQQCRHAQRRGLEGVPLLHILSRGVLRYTPMLKAPPPPHPRARPSGPPVAGQARRARVTDRARVKQRTRPLCGHFPRRSRVVSYTCLSPASVLRLFSCSQGGTAKDRCKNSVV